LRRREAAATRVRDTVAQVSGLQHLFHESVHKIAEGGQVSPHLACSDEAEHARKQYREKRAAVDEQRRIEALEVEKALTHAKQMDDTGNTRALHLHKRQHETQAEAHSASLTFGRPLWAADLARLEKRQETRDFERAKVLSQAATAAAAAVSANVGHIGVGTGRVPPDPSLHHHT